MKSVGSGVLEGDEHLNNYVLKVFFTKKMHSLKMVEGFYCICTLSTEMHKYF